MRVKQFSYQKWIHGIKENFPQSHTKKNQIAFRSVQKFNNHLGDIVSGVLRRGCQCMEKYYHFPVRCRERKLKMINTCMYCYSFIKLKKIE